MTVVKVLNGEAAKYVPATGLMLVSGSVESFQERLFVSDAMGGFGDKVTLLHEMIHHVQTLSSSYLWKDSLAKVANSVALLFPRNAEERRGGALALLRAGRAMRERAFGVSVVDLCEGVAVLESFKGISAVATPEEYLKFRDHYFPGKGNSVYRRTFDILSDAVGGAAAFDLLPVLTWLALQGDIPGRAFAMLVCSDEVRTRELLGLPAKAIASALGYPSPFPRPAEIDRFPPALRHATLYPVLSRLCAEVDPDQLIEVFARPSAAMDLPFFPPLIFGAHRLGNIRNAAYGAGRESFELRQRIAIQTAVVFAAEQIVNGRKPVHIPCPHVHCPNHESTVCAGWFTPARSPDECGFRARVKEKTGGAEPHEIAAACNNLSDNPEYIELSKTHDLDRLFPAAETIELDGDVIELAERFDRKFDLDPEDNDAAVVIVCPQCSRMRQLWVSQRRMRAGLVERCTCGAKIDIDMTRVTVIQLDASS